MSDFNFLKNPISGKWVISAPRRSHRPDGETHDFICPFCPGHEENDEVFRIGDQSLWLVRAIANKFPFTQYHEVIIHSPNHDKNFTTLPHAQVELLLQAYRHRYNAHAKKGQVYIFQNHGHAAGESIGHPHSQLVVVPFDVKLEIPELATVVTEVGNAEIPWFTEKWWGISQTSELEVVPPTKESLETEHFYITCPPTSEWPDEVWVAPKRIGEVFGSISDLQIKDLASILIKLIQIFDSRHGENFPFNYYFYPGENWYLRLIPRLKVLGGFEVGTHVSVNTQDPAETLAFIKEHFHEPNHEKIKAHQKADYRKKV